MSTKTCQQDECRDDPEVTITYTDGVVSMHTDEHATSLLRFTLPGEVLEVLEIEDVTPAHVGHFSRLGGTWWCDTCNSPYCDLA